MTITNREAVLRHLQAGEENTAKVYDFGPLKMLPHGVFGDEDGRFTLEMTEEGLRSLAKACRIPISYITTLPDSLKAENINYGLAEYGVRNKYDLIVSNFRLLGLLPRGSLFVPNSEIIDALNAAASNLDDIVEYTAWETTDTATAILMTLGEARIRIGFLLLYYRLTGTKPYAYTVIYDQTEGENEKGKIIVVPGDYVIEPSNYTSTLNTLFRIKVKDREQYFVDGYIALRTTTVTDIFPSLNDFLSFMKLGKRLSRIIYEEYTHRFNIHNLQNIVDLIYYHNKHTSMLDRILTGKDCGRLLLKVADYEHKRL